MSSGLYLEQYLDSLENLPIELQRNFTLMRDLDTRAQTLMINIDALAEEYLEGVSNGSSMEMRKSRLDEIQKHYNKAKEYGDDKVQLAIQTYELVDKHIRRLDSDLARYEADIQEKAMSTSTVEENATQKRGRKRQKDIKDTGRKKNISSEEEGKKGKKGKKGVSAKGGGKAAGAVPIPESVLPVLAGTDVLDMPVDPNEPTYCLCHQVSYGEMIGCDNPECPIEWFHFACVSLTSKPKGKWFCPKCSADRKKK